MGCLFIFCNMLYLHLQDKLKYYVNNNCIQALNPLCAFKYSVCLWTSHLILLDFNSLIRILKNIEKSVEKYLYHMIVNN